MRSLKRLSTAALILAFAQIVLGAIVRITGSGMACGDHWPKCAGAWFPPHDRLDLIIEITHRYLALALSLVVLALLIVSLTRRSEPGVGGRGGILAPAAIAAGLVVAAALLGAITVKLALSPLVVAAHLAIAMTLLAVLAVAVSRTGGFGADDDFRGGSRRTLTSARVGIALTFIILILGALTANLPGASASCGGFPWCRSINSEGNQLIIHIMHRVVAFLLFGHLWGMAASVSRRREPQPLVRVARIAFWLAVAQILVAAAMVEMQLPPVLRSLHQALGTAVWLAVVVLALLAARATREGPIPAARRMAA